MDINWKRHAYHRFWERIIKEGIEKDELDYEIKRQKVRFAQPSNQTIKTIFCVNTAG